MQKYAKYIVTTLAISGSLALLSGCDLKNDFKNYELSDSSSQQILTASKWTSENFSRLGGFAPQTNLEEKKTESCISEDPSITYLRTEGGRCRIGYWLEGKDKVKIDSIQKLVKAFSPIDTKAEAVSFIATTTPDLKINENGTIDAQTAKSSEGYLVHIMKQNKFGCGPHLPTGEVYLVTPTGETKVLATEKEVGETTMCVD